MFIFILCIDCRHRVLETAGARLMDLLDVDGSATISYPEFIAAMTVHPLTQHQPALVTEIVLQEFPGVVAGDAAI